MGGSVLSNCLQCRRPMRCRFNPWLGKIPFKRKWQLIPVFWMGQWDTPMDRGAWRPTVHRVAKSWTRLNYITLTILAQKYTLTHTHTHTHTPRKARAKQPIWSLSSDTTWINFYLDCSFIKQQWQKALCLFFFVLAIKNTLLVCDNTCLNVKTSDREKGCEYLVLTSLNRPSSNPYEENTGL